MDWVVIVIGAAPIATPRTCNMESHVYNLIIGKSAQIAIQRFESTSLASNVWASSKMAFRGHFSLADIDDVVCTPPRPASLLGYGYVDIVFSTSLKVAATIYQFNAQKQTDLHVLYVFKDCRSVR